MQLDLTTQQQQVVDHDGGLLRVRGGAGTGKSTALLRRYIRLAAEVGADRVLVLAGHAGAAQRFRRGVLAELRGGFESLAVTTPWGLAFDVVRRRRGLGLLTGAEQRALVGELLASEAGDRTLWPSLHPLLGRKGFASEVAAALAAAQAANLGPAELRSAAGASADQRWTELAGFFERYLDTLAGRGLVDGAGVLVEAASILAEPGAAHRQQARHPHVLVDDYETATPAVHHLLGSLAGGSGRDMVVAANPEVAVGSGQASSPVHFEDLSPALEVELGLCFRRPAPPLVVRCRHPSTEAEAVAGELLAARDDGVAWDDMAVLVRGHGQRARAVTRALVRHGIPVRPTPGPAGHEPAVRGLVDLLRWADGDHTAVERLLVSPLVRLDAAARARLRRPQPAGSRLEDEPALAPLVAIRNSLAADAPHTDVATLAHRAFRLALAHLVRPPGQASPADERALDALHAFLDGVTRHVEHHPGTDLPGYLAVLDEREEGLDPWVAPTPLANTVTVTPVRAAAGHEWHTVVLAGCLEGELPRVQSEPGFFHRAVLSGPTPPPGQALLAALHEERRLFALARSRSKARLVAVAAPEPGVLVSRFVEGWAEQPARVGFEPGDGAPPLLPPTAGPSPIWPDEALTLSASQLDTYQDCPLKHAYRYGLGVRGPAGVHANLGSLVHLVLERFCDPHGPVPAAERSRERLHRLAEECWRDDLAPYRPQLEEARRDLFAMLDLWWDEEGGLPEPPDVVATEHPFDVEVGPHRLTGRIDRVDRIGDGGIRVVDYKTGKSKPKPADVADDLQLATYHLAASRDTDLATVGPVRQLRLLHLRTMTAFEQEITPGHDAATENLILAVAERLRAEDIDPSVDADCDHCEFHRLCPLWPEGREVGES